MSDEQLTLDDLLIDEEELSESLLAETLIEYIRIGEDNGTIIPQPEYEDLTNRQKIVVILLAQHALEKLDIAEDEWLSPTDIAERSGIKKGSVYPVVRTLENDGVFKNNDGSYRLPVYSFEAAKEVLPGEDDE